MSPLIVPFILLPPNILHLSKLLPSIFIFTFFSTVAGIVESPFPPPNTYPIIDIVFDIVGKSLIFILTLS